MIKFIASSSALCVLIGCGGLSTPYQPQTFLQSDAINFSPETEAILVDGKVVIDNDAQTTVSFEDGQLRANFANSGSGFVGVSKHNKHLAAFAVSSLQGSADWNAAVVGRRGAFTLPSEDEAVFNGRYEAMLINKSDDGLQLPALMGPVMVVADATIGAYFDTGNVEGIVHNRQLVTGSSGTLPAFTATPFAFPLTNITEEGTFAGPTTNTALNLGNMTFSSGAGQVRGAFGGKDATTVGAVVQIAYRETPTDVSSILEQGVLIATKED